MFLYLSHLNCELKTFQLVLICVLINFKIKMNSFVKLHSFIWSMKKFVEYFIWYEMNEFVSFTLGGFSIPYSIFYFIWNYAMNTHLVLVVNYVNECREREREREWASGLMPFYFHVPMWIWPFWRYYLFIYGFNFLIN